MSGDEKKRRAAAKGSFTRTETGLCKLFDAESSEEYKKELEHHFNEFEKA